MNAQNIIIMKFILPLFIGLALLSVLGCEPMSPAGF
ncbi:MAG: hypothetical protein ACJA0J_001986, partial [Bdellovibrionota bacterium]